MVVIIVKVLRVTKKKRKKTVATKKGTRKHILRQNITF